MRVVVVGGTDFIGPAVVEELIGKGHQAVVVHRGQHEPPGLPEAPHVHCDRRDVAALSRALDGADAVVHCCCYARGDAEALVAALPERTRAVVLSSMDVYRAFGAVLAGASSDAVPLDEDSPVRPVRYPYAGKPPVVLRGCDPDTYDKLDVEETVRPAGAVVLRLPFVYGPRDHLRREEPILRRVRAGRRRIPFGAGNWLWTKGWVRDVAAAVRLAAEAGGFAGEVFNVGERRSLTVEQWARAILAAAGSDAELVRVPDAALPADLFLAGAFPQHLLVDSRRARDLLGFRETDPAEALRESVRWHLAHPPADAGADFTADDQALAAT